jgi:histone deacetylase complex regulatory component SIN3
MSNHPLQAERRRYQATMHRTEPHQTPADVANAKAYLHAVRLHAEAMGRPADVYESFMEIIRGYKDERCVFANVVFGVSAADLGTQ